MVRILLRLLWEHENCDLEGTSEGQFGACICLFWIGFWQTEAILWEFLRKHLKCFAFIFFTVMIVKILWKYHWRLQHEMLMGLRQTKQDKTVMFRNIVFVFMDLLSWSKAGILLFLKTLRWVKLSLNKNPGTNHGTAILTKLLFFLDPLFNLREFHLVPSELWSLKADCSPTNMKK